MNIQNQQAQLQQIEEQEDSQSGQVRESINNHNSSFDIQNKIKQSSKPINDSQGSIESPAKTEDNSEMQSQSQDDRRKIIRKRNNKAQNNYYASSKSNDHDLCVRFKDNEEEIALEKQKKRQEDETNENKSDNQEDSEDDENENYIVEKIIKKRIKNKKCEYFVKWQGYPSNRNTWESLKNLENVIDMIYQYEYDLPQTGKQPKVSKKILQNLDHIKIERIFGHDRLGKKSEYLVSYTDIPKPMWVLKNDLPISYYKQYKNKLQANDPVCIIQQIKTNSKEQDLSLEQNSNKRRKSSSETPKPTQKNIKNKVFSSMDEEELEEGNVSIDEEKKQAQKKQKEEKKRKITKKTIISDVESKDSDSVPQKEREKKKKLGRPKKFIQDSQNSSMVNNSIIDDEKTFSMKPKKRIKTSQQDKLNSQNKSYLDSSSNNINNLDRLSDNLNSNNVSSNTVYSQLLTQSNLQAIKNPLDQQILVKRENNSEIIEPNLQSQKSLTETYPKEGSFEAKDKVQRVIIRSSEKELEAMIFEVFWKPRPDGQQPRSKLARYDELKKNSPESLIYWLEVMVKNSVKELESDDAIIKDLREKVQTLELQIQNITISTRPNLGGVHNMIPFHLGLPQNLQFQHPPLQDFPINFQNNQEQKFLQLSNNELLKQKFTNQNQQQQPPPQQISSQQQQQMLQNKNR